MPQNQASNGTSDTASSAPRGGGRSDSRRRNGGSGRLSADLMLTLLTAVRDTTLSHLNTFAQKSIQTKGGGWRARWNEGTLAAATTLLDLYFFGAESANLTEAAIAAQEETETLSSRVVDEVRRRFTAACYFNRQVKGTPGQAQSWFAEVLASTEEFHTARRAALAAERKAQAAEELVDPNESDAVTATEEPGPEAVEQEDPERALVTA